MNSAISAMKSFFNLLKAAAIKWSDDEAPRLGGALAYYSLFSVGPLLLIAVSIAGLVFGRDAVSGELFGQLRGLIGDEGAGALSSLLKNAAQPRQAGIASIIGIATLIFGATGVIVQLKDSLNVIWGVKPKPGRGVRVFFRKYLISLTAILGFGFLLMVSLLVSASLAGISRFTTGVLPFSPGLTQVANAAVSLLVFVGMIAGIFKFLPDVHLKFRDVLPGAVLTAVLFLIGKTLIGLYLGKQSIGSTYGAAGSLVVILIWVYYSAQIVFFGAEFTAVSRQRRGPIEPEADAEVASPSAATSPSAPAVAAPRS